MHRAGARPAGGNRDNFRASFPAFQGSQVSDRGYPQPRDGQAVGSAPVEFSKELRDDIAAGDITLTYRLWRRPHAKVGGRYRVGRVEIEVDSMELVPFSGITPADVRRAGEPDRETLRTRTAHAGPIADDTLLYRIAFHVVG